MDSSQKILSDAVVFEKYAKYIPSKQRREVFSEICSRYENMMLERFPDLSSEIIAAMNKVRAKEILPSMRGFQFAGPAITKNHSRGYNCAYLPIDDIASFSEIMFLLLGGTGVGYSVQNHHVNQLPPIRKAFHKQKYLIQDSIEGWADAIKVVVEAYFGVRDTMPVLDFSDIRDKGERLVTAGGKAPGPEPLRRCIDELKAILDDKLDGDRLKPIEVHDIVCHIANSVLAGGIRRSALISLFSADDIEMIEAKSGEWWNTNPQRGRANNSAVLLRHKLTKEFFLELWGKIKASNAGEPGIYLSWDKELGTNPSLRAGTKVITSNGVYPIQDLESKNFLVPNLKGEWSNARCWKSGKDIPLWKLTFDDGSAYYASPEHKWPIHVNGRYIKCESQFLKAGDLMPINKFNRDKLFYGSLGNRDIGFVIGWLYGDGCLTKRSDTGKYVASFVVSKKESGDVLNKLLNTIEDIDGVVRKYHERDKVYEFQVGSPKFIGEIMGVYGVDKKKYGFPKKLWTDWSDEMVRGFIDGLVSADGHIPKDSHGISLRTSKTKMAKDMQELLGFYGIKSNIITSKCSPTFPNGKKYDKVYTTHLVRTTFKGRVKFGDEFKLSVKHKQQRLDQSKGYVSNNTLSQNHMILSSVELTALREDVWDIAVYDDTHCFHLPTVTTGNCCEISLRPFQYCNLVEVNAGTVVNQEDFNARVKAAAFLGTLQASFTDFHYLRRKWVETTEKDALIGVGLTGIANGKLKGIDLTYAAEVACWENERVAEIIGINKAARVTTIKPAGSTSAVLGVSSGIHSWYAKYYIRRMQLTKDSELYSYLVDNVPNLVKDYLAIPNSAVLEVPQKCPDTGITRQDETALDSLERIKKYNIEWVKAGHRDGANTNNVSATVFLKDHEWVDAVDWMWHNRDSYNGLSVLPYDNGSYVQAPFEEITEEEYLLRMQDTKGLSFDQILEATDQTDLSGEVACGGGKCEVL